MKFNRTYLLESLAVARGKQTDPRDGLELDESTTIPKRILNVQTAVMFSEQLR
jgi:hypothetical protein